MGDDLSVPGQPNVFVIGDLAHRIDPNTNELVPGVAPAAMQMGAFVGNTIARELHAKAHGLATPTREVFVYTDKGSMAIIGRNRAVASVGSLRFSGYLAFLLWAFVHILSLIGFRRKLTVFAEWGVAVLLWHPWRASDHGGASRATIAFGRRRAKPTTSKPSRRWTLTHVFHLSRHPRRFGACHVGL